MISATLLHDMADALRCQGQDRLRVLAQGREHGGHATEEARSRRPSGGSEVGGDNQRAIAEIEALGVEVMLEHGLTLTLTRTLTLALALALTAGPGPGPDPDPGPATLHR